jgi:hypothetical protein
VARTWKQSVARARKGVGKTIEGPFEIALASFEQIPPRGQGRSTDDHGDLLRQFAADVGIEESTLQGYRAIVTWWGKEKSPPGDLSWSALKEAQSEYDTSGAFRKWLRGQGKPANGHRWTIDELRSKWGKARTRSPKAAAAVEALRDPELAREVVEELDEGERLDLASAALEPMKREGEQAKADRRAVRKEIHEDPDATHYQLMLLTWRKLEDALRDLTETARDAQFEEKYVVRLQARIQITREMLEMLELAITGTENVDWDAELERLGEAAAETESNS